MTMTSPEMKLEIEPYSDYGVMLSIDGVIVGWLERKAAEKLLAYVAALEEKVRELERQKDGAYEERDKLVALLSKVFPAWLERHPDADTTWDNDWRWIVFLNIPDQVSWHIHDSELWMFDHLERKEGNSWDGHTTPEKYARCQLAARTKTPKGAQEKRNQ